MQAMAKGPDTYVKRLYNSSKQHLLPQSVVCIDVSDSMFSMPIFRPTAAYSSGVRASKSVVATMSKYIYRAEIEIVYIS